MGRPSGHTTQLAWAERPGYPRAFLSKLEDARSCQARALWGYGGMAIADDVMMMMMCVDPEFSRLQALPTTAAKILEDAGELLPPTRTPLIPDGLGKADSWITPVTLSSACSLRMEPSSFKCMLARAHQRNIPARE